MYTCSKILNFQGKSSSQQGEYSFNQKYGLEMKEETAEMLHKKHSCAWCRNVRYFKSRSEILCKFEKSCSGERWRKSCDKWRSITQSQRNTERTRIRGKKRKQLLYVIKELTGYCKLKQEALDRSVRRTRFDRDYGHVCCKTFSRAVFLNRRAAARYRALASIIPGRERFSWNLSF